MSRYGIMAIQLLAMLTTVRHLLKCGLVVYLASPRHLFHSIPLDRCFVSQLNEMFLCLTPWVHLECSIFEEIDSCRVPPIVFVLDKDLEGKDVKINVMQGINVLTKCNLDREDCVGFVSPLSSYITSWISGWDSCFVGVSCHNPSSVMHLG